MRRHTVRTRHPRYKIPKYERGKGHSPPAPKGGYEVWCGKTFPTIQEARMHEATCEACLEPFKKIRADEEAIRQGTYIQSLAHKRKKNIQITLVIGNLMDEKEDIKKKFLHQGLTPEHSAIAKKMIKNIDREITDLKKGKVAYNDKTYWDSVRWESDNGDVIEKFCKQAGCSPVDLRRSQIIDIMAANPDRYTTS